jgi:acetyl esterase/lipase
MVREDVLYHRDGDRELRLDIAAPDRPGELRTAVIQIHGGRWRVGTRKSLAAHGERLARLGFTALAIEYRPVVEAPWPSNLRDVKAAIRWTRAHAEELDIDPRRIALAGFSSGGHLALMAAGTAGHPDLDHGGDPAVGSAVGAVAVAYPSVALRPARGDGDRLRPDIDAAGDVPSWILLGEDASDEEVAQASVPAHLSASFPPTLIVHGTADTVIPHESSLRLYRRLAELGVDCDLHLYGGQDHVFDAGPSFGDVFDREVALFLRRTISAPEQISAETPRFAEILARTSSAAMTAPVARA